MAEARLELVCTHMQDNPCNCGTSWSKLGKYLAKHKEEGFTFENCQESPRNLNDDASTLSTQDGSPEAPATSGPAPASVAPMPGTAATVAATRWCFSQLVPQQHVLVGGGASAVGAGGTISTGLCKRKSLGASSSHAQKTRKFETGVLRRSAQRPVQTKGRKSVVERGVHAGQPVRRNIVRRKIVVRKVKDDKSAQEGDQGGWGVWECRWE